MIVMMCQVPVCIDYRMHLNTAKQVWIISVMIRTKTMTLILKKKEMPKFQISNSSGGEEEKKEEEEEEESEKE
jgi:hypothetical protein